MRSSILLSALSVALGVSGCSGTTNASIVQSLLAKSGIILLHIENASGQLDLDCVDKHARGLMKDDWGVSSVSVKNTPTQKILASNSVPDEEPSCYRGHYEVYARNYPFGNQYDLIAAYICVPPKGKAWAREDHVECDEWEESIQEKCIL